MNLEKASIDIVSGSKAGTQIRVLFNPTEYTLDRSNTYKATSIPGLGGPLFHFINGEADSLAMELFLDDYTDQAPGGKTVRDRVDEIAALLEIDNNLHAPPIVRFVWGKLSFTAIIEKLTRKLTLFKPDGVPARATLNVSFKEYRTLPELTINPRLQSADKSKRRVIIGNDSLWLLASREYHDVNKWKVIAEHNDLDDPRDIAPGDWMTIPPLEQDNGSRRRV
ncbi:LysM peptidoglycan-binding domain-containing protein [Bradyrhizobium symbiodeficiens]|uniref:LysM peptidoglycan-binding domain-containing protein n=1 Tax=Bradyrhizobium symbiodeficiens TaxID=1404367 RepID=A0ABX5W2S5_9BRAD|nr:LysM peptidoglycan-binding domain-containing protein [Bradyrhizobium symbiodeficiens]QDF37511.1 LysM peptidoglycan-binding domain-containing protein [Bradyrhizobium symbiodeficiens]